MQTRQSVKNIRSGEPVCTVLLLATASRHEDRNGRPYWKLELSDASGAIGANIWSPLSTEFITLPVGELVRVEGSAGEFRGRAQITVSALTPLTPGELAAQDMADFLPASPRPIEDMWQELRGLVERECTHAPWRALLDAVLTDPAIAGPLRSMPAAKSMHHAYAGGLLEHSLSVAGLALRLADHYPFVDRQCLLAGAVLHDLGKIWEFSGGIANDYTTAGRLLGHMELALEHLAPHLAASGLEPELAQHLKHLILSHHGTREFGANSLPQTAEAFLLHHADIMDAKMFQCQAPFADWEAGQTGWSPWLASLERSIYQPARTAAAAPMAHAPDANATEPDTTEPDTVGAHAPDATGLPPHAPGAKPAAVPDAVCDAPDDLPDDAPDDDDPRFAPLPRAPQPPQAFPLNEAGGLGLDAVPEDNDLAPDPPDVPFSPANTPPPLPSDGAAPPPDDGPGEAHAARAERRKKAQEELCLSLLKV